MATGRARRWTAAAVAFAAIDLSFHLFNGWVALDEGALALAGRLVREGQWPHRDFADVYSGGLAAAHAATQWILGDDLRALRIPFGLAVLLWVPLLAACFRRFLPAPAAAGLAVLGYLWGPSLYPAAMPSWYLLFLGTFVAWCLLRWHESGRPGWWSAAGVAIGCAILIKINALFLLAGAGAVLLTVRGARNPRVTALLLWSGIAGAWVTVSRGWALPQTLTLLLPLALLALRATWRGPTTSLPQGEDPPSWRTEGAMLAAGVAAVLVPWLGAYALTGGLAALVDGVLVLPFRRATFANYAPPTWGWIELAVAGAGAGLLIPRWSERALRTAAVALGLLALVAIERAHLDPETTVPLVWRIVRALGVLGLLGIPFVLERGPADRRTPLLVVGWIAGWFALVQYPFASTAYVAYVAPLLLLAAAAVASRSVSTPVGAVLGFALAAWSLGVNHGLPLSVLGRTYVSPPPALAPLDLPRGGLRVPAAEAAGYRAIVETLDRWGARAIVAGPDTPEIYYLSGRPLPDRELFEFLAPEWSAAVLAARIGARHPDAAVLNTVAYFSRVPIDSVLAQLPIPPIADTVIGPFLLLRFPSAPRGSAPRND